jgi:hypothetical protein
VNLLESISSDPAMSAKVLVSQSPRFDNRLARLYSLLRRQGIHIGYLDLAHVSPL